MHEYSIVQALLKQCEDIAKQNSATQIEKIVLKIGVLSGVEIHLLKVAFETFCEDTIANGAKLDIIEEKIKIRCNECNHESQIDDNVFVCHECNSANIEVIEGEDMYLMQVVLQ
jgi:hydrogenase nickel insertion protein HypA